MPVSPARDHVYVSAECLVGFVSVVNNIVVLVVISRNQVFPRINNCFIGNLAVADLLVGLVAAPIVIVSFAGLTRDFHSCILASSFVVVLTNASVLSLVAVVVERYLAIAKPLIYLRVARKRFATGVIGSCWLLATLLGLIPNMGWNNGHERFTQTILGWCHFTSVIRKDYLVYLIFFSLITPSLITMLTLSAKLFHDTNKRVNTGTRDDYESGEFLSTHSRRTEEAHAVRTLPSAVLVFAFCVMPIHMYNTVQQFTQNSIISDDNPFVLIIIVLSHMTSITNPIIFAFSSKHFRYAVQSMLQQVRHSSVTPLPAPSQANGCETSTQSNM